MRPSLLLCLLVSGCVEADLADLPALAEIRVDDPFADRVDTRTEVQWLGEVRLVEDGDATRHESRARSWMGLQLPVVGLGDGVRVRYDSGDAELLLWLDPQDLGLWVIDDARGAARPEFFGGEAGVWFDGGTEVEHLDQFENWSAVGIQTRDFEARVWVPSVAVGPYWIERERGPIAEDHDAWLFGRAELLDRPFGDTLGEVAQWSDDEQLAFVGAAVLEERDEHVLVELSDSGVSVRAWVAASHVSDWPHGGRGFCGGGGVTGFRGLSMSPSLELPAGTELHAGPGGEIVGRTTVTRSWGFGREVDGYIPVQVPTAWGPMTLWVW